MRLRPHPDPPSETDRGLCGPGLSSAAAGQDAHRIAAAGVERRRPFEEFARCEVLFGGLANPNTVWVARFRRCRGGKGPPSCPQPAPASRGRSWSWTTGVSRAAGRSWMRTSPTTRSADLRPLALTALSAPMPRRPLPAWLPRLSQCADSFIRMRPARIRSAARMRGTT